MEPDDAGLQPQTSLKFGELREIDASGGGKSAAKRLKRGGRPFFPFVGSRNSGKRSHHPPTGIFHRGRKTSNLEKYFSFLLLTVNPAGSFHTASRLVRRRTVNVWHTTRLKEKGQVKRIDSPNNHKRHVCLLCQIFL